MSTTFAVARELNLVALFKVSNEEELEYLQIQFNEFKRRFELASYIEEDKVINVLVSLDHTVLTERTRFTVCGCRVTLKDTRDLVEVKSSPVEIIYRFGKGMKTEAFVIHNTMPK